MCGRKGNINLIVTGGCHLGSIGTGHGYSINQVNRGLGKGAYEREMAAVNKDLLVTDK